MKSATRTTPETIFSKPNETDLRIERSFDAPIALVWQAFTNARLLAAWMGPRRFKTRVDALDVRPGGRWRFVNIDAEGNEYAFSGEFLEVEPPRRLVQTWAFEGMADASCVQTMTLVERNGRTHLAATATYPSRAHRDAHLENGMEEGTRETYERLDEILRSQQ